MARAGFWSVGLLASALATAGVGWVTAQESAVGPVVVPPEETVGDPSLLPRTPGQVPPPAGPNAPAPPTGATPPGVPPSGASPPPAGIAPPPPDNDPAPYRVLGPSSRAQPPAPRVVEPPPPPPPPPPPVEEEVEEEAEEEPEGPPPPPPPPPRRPRHSVAIVQALDKVTAETLRFEVPVGRAVRYKTLVFRLNTCETQALDEPLKESAAHLAIVSRPKAQPGRVTPAAAQVFRGWMFASAPGLNPFEHPVYDAWLIGCRIPPPVIQRAGGSAPGVSAPPTAPGRSR